MPIDRRQPDKYKARDNIYTQVIESTGSRMIHIADYEGFHEQGYYAPGDTGAPVYETAIGRVGVFGEPALHDLQVPIAQVVPEESIELLGGIVETILLERLPHFANRAPGAGQYPAI